jgi:DNA-directed RNA polymerase subunit RPC12/RpoP
MAKRAAMPLFGSDAWVNVTVHCQTCGDSLVGYRHSELVEKQPDLVCPMCDEPTGQKTVVEAQA